MQEEYSSIALHSMQEQYRGNALHSVQEEYSGNALHSVQEEYSGSALHSVQEECSGNINFTNSSRNLKEFCTVAALLKSMWGGNTLCSSSTVTSLQLKL
jgi:hypothetical protein